MSHAGKGPARYLRCCACSKLSRENVLSAAAKGRLARGEPLVPQIALQTSLSKVGRKGGFDWTFRDLNKKDTAELDLLEATCDAALRTIARVRGEPTQTEVERLRARLERQQRVSDNALDVAKQEIRRCRNALDVANARIAELEGR